MSNLYGFGNDDEAPMIQEALRRTASSAAGAVPPQVVGRQENPRHEGSGRPGGTRPSQEPSPRSAQPPVASSRPASVQKKGGIARTANPAPELAIPLIFIALVLWLANAVYTVDGAIVFANLVLAWFRFALVIPFFPAPVTFVLAILLGYFVSRAQILRFPFWRKNGVWVWNGGYAAIIAWVLISAADVVSTAAGFTVVSETSWAIHRWAAETPFASVLWSLFLSFGPEFLLIAAWVMAGWKVPVWLRKVV